MYPLKAILIGCNEHETGLLRHELSNLVVDIEDRFAALDDIMKQRQAISELPCFFLVRVNSGEDLNTIQVLLRAFKGKPVLALMNTDRDQSAVLRTFAAGAAQAILLPLKPSELRVALETLALQFGYDTGAARVIAVSSVTGGCGATTLAINLAWEVATVYEKDCILVELSAHLGRLALNLDLKPKVSTYDVLTQSGPLDIENVKWGLIKLMERLQVLAGPWKLPARVPVAAERFHQLIEQLRQLASVVVVDVPSSFDEVYWDTLQQADNVLLVGEQSVPSIHDLAVVREALDQPGRRGEYSFVINKYDSSERTFGLARLRELLPASVLHTVALDVKAFRACLNNGTVLRNEVPNSRALQDIDALARTLVAPNQTFQRQHTGWLPKLLRRVIHYRRHSIE